MGDLSCRACGSSVTYQKPKGQHMGLFCAGCDKWRKWVSQPFTVEEAFSFKMPFGKYKGRTLNQIPEGHLWWLHRNAKGRIASMALAVYEIKAQDACERLDDA